MVSSNDSHINLDIDAVEKLIDHKFNNQTLIIEALTHRSVSHGKTHGYERLEFLGDRILGLLIADLLFAKFPDEPEGALSRRFNDLVRQETLADIAASIGLKDHILLGKAERLAASFDNPAIVSDICESIIAAIYLDAGIEAASKFINHHWQQRLIETLQPPKDAKSSLQEWAMAHKLPIPTYMEIKRDGPDHAPIFTIQVTIKDKPPEQAKAASKRLAEQNAAEIILRKLTGNA